MIKIKDLDKLNKKELEIYLLKIRDNIFRKTKQFNDINLLDDLILDLNYKIIDLDSDTLSEIANGYNSVETNFLEIKDMFFDDYELRLKYKQFESMELDEDGDVINNEFTDIGHGEFIELLDDDDLKLYITFLQNSLDNTIETIFDILENE